MVMTPRFALAVFPALFLAGTVSGADAGNMSGKWRLNIEKSEWGEKHRPQSVHIEIHHHEPQLKYAGTVTDASGLVTKFAFDGAIDNKEYLVTDAGIERRVTIKRISPLTTTTTMKSADGKITENTTTTVSQDGKTLTRHIILKTAEGTTKWTEVYDRVE
jgi:hypothetical protein